MRSWLLLLLVTVFSLSASAQAKVKLSDLKNHVGDSVVIEGRVTKVQQPKDSNYSATLITIGDKNNSVDIVISSAVRKKFSVKPEEAYRNKSIRVSGKLLNNNNRMQIAITESSQIVTIDNK